LGYRACLLAREGKLVSVGSFVPYDPPQIRQSLHNFIHRPSQEMVHCVIYFDPGKKYIKALHLRPPLADAFR